jgi:capsular polysaccharide transport system permease protein
MELVSAPTPFFHSLRIQFRVIGALLMREIITRYGRANLGFAWLFIEPMIFTLAVTALWVAFRMNAHFSNIPIVAFALTGYSSVLMWRNCATRAGAAISPNIPLLYHRNVRVLDLVFTRILLEIAGATISFVVLGALWISLGLCELPHNMLKVLGGWVLLVWFAIGLALVIGAMTSYSEILERLWHPVVYLMWPLSGAVFMVEWLPRDLQQMVLWLPMVHCLELIREGFFGPVIRMHYDLGYVFVVCLGLTLLGLTLVKAAGRRVRFE